MEAANHTRLWAGSIIITGPEVRPVEDAAADFLCSHARRVRMGKGVGLFRLRSCGPDLQAALPPTTVRMDYPMEVTLASFRQRQNPLRGQCRFDDTFVEMAIDNPCNSYAS